MVKKSFSKEYLFLILLFAVRMINAAQIVGVDDTAGPSSSKTQVKNTAPSMTEDLSSSGAAALPLVDQDNACNDEKSENINFNSYYHRGKLLSEYIFEGYLGIEEAKFLITEWTKIKPKNSIYSYDSNYLGFLSDIGILKYIDCWIRKNKIDKEPSFSKNYILIVDLVAQYLFISIKSLNIGSLDPRFLASKFFEFLIDEGKKYEKVSKTKKCNLFIGQDNVSKDGTEIFPKMSNGEINPSFDYAILIDFKAVECFKPINLIEFNFTANKREASGSFEDLFLKHLSFCAKDSKKPIDSNN
jgi:hypothetical protein